MAVTETGWERVAREERLLAGLREQHPDCDFHRMSDGWLMLPKGTEFTYTSNLVTLALQLAKAPT